MKYKIGIDVSGGDYAPGEVFLGAVMARDELKESIVLIGVQKEIEEQARLRIGGNLSGFEVVDAPEKIDMGEPPAISVRRKRKSSIVVGCELLKQGRIDAFVSCGNTGAMVCGASFTPGLIEGVERPGIALVVPTQKGFSLMVDVGANIDPKPLQLLHYGAMASVYYGLVLGKTNPTVGLLNIGEEASKGSGFLKETHKLFAASSLNFIGNLEAKGLFAGDCDCVVCDGLVGNIALKVTESCAEFLGRAMVEKVKKRFLGRLGLLLAMPGLKDFKAMLDYSEYGGAPLLGVDGVVIIGHGRSNSVAVKNAIKAAVKELDRDVNTEIKRKINEFYQNDKLMQILSAQ